MIDTADAMVLGTGFTKVTTDGVEHIPYDRVMAETTPIPFSAVEQAIQDNAGDEPPGDEPPSAVSLFDEVAVAHASDDPTAALTDAGKTDRKTYLREYMRARRQREREEKQRAAEAGTGATDQ